MSTETEKKGDVTYEKISTVKDGGKYVEVTSKRPGSPNQHKEGE